MKFRVVIIFVFFACYLLPGISLAQNKVVVIPLGTDATGDATEAHVLQGKTFSNQNNIGIAGSRPPAPLPKVGANAVFGVAIPNPRFAGGMLTGGFKDNLTSLRWANPDNNIFDTYVTASNHCGTKTVTVLNITYDDWRLPNIKELLSIIEYYTGDPALPYSHPFTDVLSSEYWSSTILPSIAHKSGRSTWATAIVN